jgi:hypothetical protein
MLFGTALLALVGAGVHRTLAGKKQAADARVLVSSCCRVASASLCVCACTCLCCVFLFYVCVARVCFIVCMTCRFLFRAQVLFLFLRPLFCSYEQQMLSRFGEHVESLIFRLISFFCWVFI